MWKEAKSAKKLVADVLAVKCKRTLTDVFDFMRKRQQEQYPSCSREEMIRKGKTVGRIAIYHAQPLVFLVDGTMWKEADWHN
jgi:hypothetical protein